MGCSLCKDMPAHSDDETVQKKEEDLFNIFCKRVGNIEYIVFEILDFLACDNSVDVITKILFSNDAYGESRTGLTKSDYYKIASHYTALLKDSDSESQPSVPPCTLLMWGNARTLFSFNVNAFEILLVNHFQNQTTNIIIPRNYISSDESAIVISKIKCWYNHNLIKTNLFPFRMDICFTNPISIEYLFTLDQISFFKSIGIKLDKICGITIHDKGIELKWSDISNCCKNDDFESHMSVKITKPIERPQTNSTSRRNDNTDGCFQSCYRLPLNLNVFDRTYNNVDGNTIINVDFIQNGLLSKLNQYHITSVHLIDDYRNTIDHNSDFESDLEALALLGREHLTCDEQVSSNRKIYLYMGGNHKHDSYDVDNTTEVLMDSNSSQLTIGLEMTKGKYTEVVVMDVSNFDMYTVYPDAPIPFRINNDWIVNNENTIKDFEFINNEWIKCGILSQSIDFNKINNIASTWVWQRSYGYFATRSRKSFHQFYFDDKFNFVGCCVVIPNTINRFKFVVSKHIPKHWKIFGFQCEKAESKQSMVNNDVDDARMLIIDSIPKQIEKFGIYPTPQIKIVSVKGGFNLDHVLQSRLTWIGFTHYQDKVNQVFPFLTDEALPLRYQQSSLLTRQKNNNQTIIFDVCYHDGNNKTIAFDLNTQTGKIARREPQPKRLFSKT